MPLERRRPMGGHDSGAVAVETALVSMLLVTILFGIIESSFLLKDYLTVSAAARAGARMGSSEPGAANFAQDSADQVTNAISGLSPTAANIKVWVYRTKRITGARPAQCDSSTACVPFRWGGTKLSPLLATDLGNWTSASQNACAGDVNRDALGVYVEYQHSGLGFFFKGKIVSESTVMWLEPSYGPSC